MDSKSMIRVMTKKRVTPIAPTGKVETQYPSLWFENNPGRKPSLSLYLTANTLEDARGIVKNSLMTNDIKLEHAMTFLYYFFLNVKCKLDEDWKSFNVIIGKKDEEISPWDLLQVTGEVRKIEGISTQSKEADDPWIALYVLGIYRLVKAGMAEYRTTLSRKINEQMTALAIASKTTEMTDIVDIYSGWTSDQSYNKMVAAVDMYFNKFPHHKYAPMRVGTTGSRYKDCSGLLSYGYLQEALGMDKMTDLMDWVFVNKIGDDIDRMMQPGEESEDPYSYFPYQVDLGLVARSAYSATVNPHFYEFVHLTGALLKYTRSTNARHISDAQSLNILLNAGCLAYAYSHTYQMTKVYTNDGTFEIKEDSGDEDDDDDLGGGESRMYEEVYKSRDPLDWITLLSSTKFQMPAKVKSYIQEIGKKIKDPRPQSMNEHLKAISTGI